MVLRCSLLGHDYGDAEVEREREERGSEVVVTVQEYEECSRCGDRTVLSENTEVRSLSAEEPTDADVDPGAASVAADDEDVEVLEDESGDDAPETDDGEADEIEIPTDENGDPVTDDGEILEDDDDPVPDRERGEWPDSDDVGPPVADEAAEESDWPEQDDPEAVEDDGVILEDDDEMAGGGESIAAGATAAPAESASADADAESGTGIQRAGSAPAPGKDGGAPTDGSLTEFYCPRCDFVAPGDRGSLRNGDICPECRKGYLSERDRR